MRALVILAIGLIGGFAGAKVLEGKPAEPAADPKPTPKAAKPAAAKPN